MSKHVMRVLSQRDLIAKSLIVILMLLGIWYMTSSLYIYAKAQLAQVLLANAWQQTMDTGKQIKPWSWADTWPVARLEVPSQGVELIVLAGDSGRSLAFGPGHRFGTVEPGHIGNSVISGHRDTHFEFLKDLAFGELIRVQATDGVYRYYEVVETRVVDENKTLLPNSEQEAMLTLVTCYPFDAVEPGGSLRYLVFAQEVHTVAL